MYQAGDGEWFFLACGNQSFWAKLCNALGREDLRDDPRFGSWLARRDNAEALTPLLEATFKSRPRDEWLKILAGLRHPRGRHADAPATSWTTPPSSTTRWRSTYDHPEVGRLTVMGQPLRFSAPPVPDAGAAADARTAHGGGSARGGLRRRGIADLGRRRVVVGKDLPA